MAKLIIIVALLAFAGVVSAFNYNAETLAPLWASWKAQHKKAYTATEELTRFQIFVENFNKIQKHNAEFNDVKFAVNKFADLTASEFKALFANGANYKNSEKKVSKRSQSFRRNLSAIPDTVDWRNKGAVTSVKDQGQCTTGGYVFATVAALESYNFIKTGELLSFSEQQVIGCSAPYYGYGCAGGWVNNVLEYTAINGLALESDYPFTGEDDDCKFDSSKAHKINNGYHYVDNYLANFKAAVADGPVAALVEVDQDVFQFYSKGVVTAGCGANHNHAVLVVGYQKVGALEAFIVKNSWGTSWGQDGYIYISTIQAFNQGDGACGILAGAMAPN